jgi:osmotically-inducible protein OsmY
MIQIYGWIDTEVQRQALRAAAENTAGVKSVDDHLMVLRRTRTSQE